MVQFIFIMSSLKTEVIISMDMPQEGYDDADSLVPRNIGTVPDHDVHGLLAAFKSYTGVTGPLSVPWLHIHMGRKGEYSLNAE